ncbi:hypothetical protein Tco_0363032 [Tanacetum coccineum]
MFILNDRSTKEEYESHMKMIVESLKEEKMYVMFSNNVEAEQRGSYLDVEGIKWVGADLAITGRSRRFIVLKKDCMTNVMLYRGVGRRSEAKNEFEIDVRRSDLEGTVPTSVKRDGEWFILVRQGSDLHLERLLMPRVVKSRDEIFSRWGYCDNHDLSRLDNQSIERDRLIGIGFVLNFVKFISFTFGDKEMISVIEAIIREVFLKLLLKLFGKLSIRHGLYETIVCYVLLANMIWIVVLERDHLKALMDDWNDCKSCKVRVGLNGNLLWEASVLIGRKKDDRGVTEGREDVREVFQQCRSRAKRKLSKCGRNQMGNEPILAFPEGPDDFVVYYDARSKDLEAGLEKREGDCWTLAIEEAYTTKYSIHPGADTMLCGFRLTNRWLSMKKVIASCGSKCLAYLEVEVEYQGSSGLLLQPELPE